jgi:hypothetical protein
MPPPFRDPRALEQQVPFPNPLNMKPFQEQPAGPPLPGSQQPPFAAPLQVYPQRIFLAAGDKIPLTQTGIPCQKIVIFNEGGGDLYWGIDAVSFDAPTAGSNQPSFRVPNGAGTVIEKSNTQHIVIGSDSGCIISVNIEGISNLPGAP